MIGHPRSACWHSSLPLLEVLKENVMPMVQVQTKVQSSGGFSTEIVGTYDFAFLPHPGMRVAMKAQHPVDKIEPGTKVYGVVADSPETTLYATDFEQTVRIDAMIFIEKVLPTGIL
jgi:hypothetical protein